MNQRADDSADPALTEGMLYLTAPRPEIRQNLLEVLAAFGLAIDEPHEGIVRTRVAAGTLAQLGERILARLSTQELRCVRCCVLPEGTLPTLSDLMQTESLESLVDRAQAEWLVELIRSARLTTFFQPIVRSTEPSNIVAYECLLRGKHTDGTIIPPDRMFRAARSSGLLYHLDRTARLTAIKTASACRLRGDIFINFNPTSIYDPVHCLQSTIRAIAESGIAPQRFVFEVVESEEIKDTGRLLKILDYYREAGLRVALDDVGAGYSSLTLLTRLKPDFIKLDMDLIRNVDSDRYKSQVASKLLELARELHVGTVVEGVETIGEWQWAVEHGADLAQGFLFAGPQPWISLTTTRCGSALSSEPEVPTTSGSAATGPAPPVESLTSPCTTPLL